MVPFGAVIKNDMRYKEKEVKDKSNPGKKKKITAAVHLERPSASPYVLFDEEKTYFEGLEGPWNRIKILAEEHKKGVLLKDIEKVRKTYKECYDEQFKICDKLKGFRSSRSKALNELSTLYFSQRRNQTVEYNKANLDRIKEMLTENLISNSFQRIEDTYFTSLFPFKQVAVQEKQAGSRTSYGEIRSLIRENKKKKSKTKNLDQYFERNSLFIYWLNIELAEEIDELISNRWDDSQYNYESEEDKNPLSESY
jgi:hypothetical protein